MQCSFILFLFLSHTHTHCLQNTIFLYPEAHTTAKCHLVPGSPDFNMNPHIFYKLHVALGHIFHAEIFRFKHQR